MNYGTIKPYDIADGPGVRVSLFVSGCRHHCKGCFNSETWRFDYGMPFTRDTQNEILQLLAPDYIAGFSLLGGEPFEPENQPALSGLLQAIRKSYPDKTIWCYTGYRYDTDLVPGGCRYLDVTDELLDQIDVLIDGEFVEAQKNIRLNFRGSENQRILDLKKTRSENRIVLHPLNN